MNTCAKRVLSLGLSLALTLGFAACGSREAADPPVTKAERLSMDARPDAPDVIPEGLDIDWNCRYTFAELESQLAKIAETYPDITELYSIGTSWQERDLWCMEITNKAVPAEEKTGIGVFANIHGGERESAASAMYTAWWLTLCSADSYVKGLLDSYTIYVIPVINPDGYEQSFVVNTRPNLRPQDKNGDNIPFGDPYTDIDGDGFIATLYRGRADDTPSRQLPVFGTESPDWDGNGVLGDDPRTSGIDMNRTFDYQWNRYDIETKDGQQIGNVNWATAGTAPATEPEIQALQRFLYEKEIDALASLHTGIQSVLYPWCYRAYDADNPDDAEIPFMQETAAAMAQAFEDYTGRGFYSMSSNEDYPTAAELIDYAYGRYKIHAYTIEVYSPGKSQSGDITECKWENTMPEAKWVFYDRDAIRDTLGLDPDAITDKDGVGLAADEGLWFYTSPTNQMVNRAPEEQDVMVRGCRDALLTMIESEPAGGGYRNPGFYK